MELDCLLIYIPKLKNYYKLFGSHMFGMFMPMGLFAIADLASQSGYKTQILHLGIERIENKKFSLNDYIAKNKPKIIGLPLHWHFQSYDVIKIAQEIKSANPDIFIVLGGFTATFFYDEIMEKFGSIDGVIKGDGEIPFLRLAEAIVKGGQSLYNVPNLSWRRGNEIIKNEINYIAQNKDLDKLSFTNLHLLKNYELYVKYVKDPGFWINGLSKRVNLKLLNINYYNVFPLFVSRGCFVNCSFCGGCNDSQKMVANRNGVVFRSIDKVLGSIEELKRYGYDTIRMDCFPAQDGFTYFNKLFAMIKAKGIKVACIAEYRALPSLETLELFSAAFDLSKSAVFLSPESGSEEVRKLNKGYYYDNSELLKTIDRSINFGIKTEVFFSLGLPFETIDTIKITKEYQDFLKKVYKDKIIVRTEFVGLDPASPMYMEPEKYKIIKTWGSFLDFYHAHAGADNFFNTALGYYKKEFCKKENTAGNLTKAQLFENEIRKIYCKNFCKVNNLLLRKIKIGNMKLFARTFSAASNLFCSFVKQLLRCI